MSIFLKFKVLNSCFQACRRSGKAVLIPGFFQDSYQGYLRSYLIACFLSVQQPCNHSGSLSGRLAVILSLCQPIQLSGEPDSWAASVHAFRQSYKLAFLHSCNLAGSINCQLDCVPSALPEVRAACHPAIIQRQRTDQFHSIVCLWHCLAIRGTVWHCGTVQRYRKQGFTLYCDFY